MKKEDRPKGFYWVILNGTWGVAEYLGMDEGWDYDEYRVMEDDFFEKIYDKIEDYGKKRTGRN